MQFRKDKEATIWALIDVSSKVNAITLINTKQLGLQIQKTDVSTPKIDSSLLKIYKIAIASFKVINKLSKAQFFQKTFLLANTSMKVVLGMAFLIFNNANIQFIKKSLLGGLPPPKRLYLPLVE